MRALFALSVALSSLVAGCRPSLFCGQPRDATGRLVPLCENQREEPVCDEPGSMARYEEGLSGLVLVGGQRALCDGDDVVICPAGTVGEPYCLLDPEL
ncbi:MAG: hypothetical protein KF729_38465 [Sandaracinaceae bacterium]|nr:hypothetical protein [Sandaracinaceae bacterium]